MGLRGCARTYIYLFEIERKGQKIAHLFRFEIVLFKIDPGSLAVSGIIITLFLRTIIMVPIAKEIW